MKNFDSIVCFLMAFFAAYFGVAGKEFYPGRIGRKSRGKPWPRWFGRLWFLTGAAILLYWGIKKWH